MSREHMIAIPFMKALYVFWGMFIVRPVFRYQAWRCERAKAYLIRHDTEYRNQHAGQEIVRRRNALYAVGVSPMNPMVPDRWTMEEELPPLAWPRTRSSL